MNFQITLSDGSLQSIWVNSDVYKTWKVWRVKFDKHQEVILYKIGSEWVQRNEDNLDMPTIKEIGSCIDNVVLGNKIIAI